MVNAPKTRFYHKKWFYNTIGTIITVGFIGSASMTFKFFDYHNAGVRLDEAKRAGIQSDIIKYQKEKEKNKNWWPWALAALGFGTYVTLSKKIRVYDNDKMDGPPSGSSDDNDNPNKYKGSNQTDNSTPKLGLECKSQSIDSLVNTLVIVPSKALYEKSDLSYENKVLA